MLGIVGAGDRRSPYLVPQEFGLRTDCRWFEFVRSDTGESVRIDVLRPAALHVSATRFRAADLYAAGHETDLRPRRTLVVHVDVAHRGIGTASCGPDILDRYRVPAAGTGWRIGCHADGVRRPRSDSAMTRIGHRDGP